LSHREKAELAFRIGRLNSMAYACKENDIEVLKEQTNLVNEGKASPFFGVGMSDFAQFRVENTTSDANAKNHLAAAVKYLQDAIKLEPSLSQAKLGLAWCLDQSGEPAKAIPLYREVYKEAYEQERNKNGLRGMSVAVETSGYLQKLLNPTKDAAELARMKEQTKNLENSFRAVTPIMVPLTTRLTLSDFTRPASVRFDLDGNGPKHYDRWTGQKAGWLVYDSDKSKHITSGLQLFGPSSFWIFWNHGYEAMKALDDNDDNKLQGAELDGLAVWCDTNGDGKSDAGEVKAMSELGISSLSCQSQVDARGTISSTRGVTFADGSTADTYDIILNQVP
jgi:tetratricopeptide (TPR) repeat protein